MNKLLHANFMRLKRNKVFWTCCILTVLLLESACLNQYKWMQELQTHYYLDNFLFGFLIYIGIMLSVFSSLFTGTEYNDGTIRNKIISGHRRASIYLANGITCSFAGIIISIISILAVLIVGAPMFGSLQMPIGLLVLHTATALLVCLTYASVFNLIAMLIANRTYTAITCILLAVLLLPISFKIYDLLGINAAQSQMSEMATFIISSLSFSMAESTLLVITILSGCILLIFISNLIGILLFRRKDLK